MNTTNSDTQLLHSSGLKMVEFYTTLFGTSRIMALCNVVIIESGQKNLANRDLTLPSWKRSSNETSASDNQGDHSPPHQVEQNSKDSIGEKHALKRYYQFDLSTSCFWGSMYRIKYYPSCAI